MAKPGAIFAKPLSVLLSDVFSDAYAKQGFAARELVTRWAEIIGPLRTVEVAMATTRGRADTGTSHAHAAGGRPHGA
jgi:hypothetical protein